MGTSLCQQVKTGTDNKWKSTLQIQQTVSQISDTFMVCVLQDEAVRKFWSTSAQPHLQSSLLSHVTGSWWALGGESEADAEQVFLTHTKPPYIEFISITLPRHLLLYNHSLLFSPK